MRAGRVVWWAGVVAMGAYAGPAFAHAPIAGMGVFLSGAAHPFIAPALLLSLTALGLLMGQRAAGRIEQVRGLFLIYGVGLAAGLVVQALGGEVDTDRLLLLCGALAGAAVALAWALPPAANGCLAAVVGLATGMASGPTGVAGRDLAVMLAGTVLATLALPAWVLAMVCEVRRPWLKIAVRVLGSWLAAAALLVLSLTFAPSARATGGADGEARSAGRVVHVQMNQLRGMGHDDGVTLSAAVAGHEQPAAPNAHGHRAAGRFGGHRGGAHRSVPGSPLVVIDDCRHRSTIEQPAAATAALTDWLRAPVPAG